MIGGKPQLKLYLLKLAAAFKHLFLFHALGASTA
jgi:hypothetical protein